MPSFKTERFFKAECCDDLPRVAIVSFPKSGTYLYGKLLNEIGFVDTEIHVTYDGKGYDDFRGLPVEDKRKRPASIQHAALFPDISSKFRRGQFFVGHIDYACQFSLSMFRCIFTYREIRQCLVSHMRFMIATGRRLEHTERLVALPEGPERMITYLDGLGREFIDRYGNLTGWMRHDGVLKTSYETLYGDYGEERQIAEVLRIADFCDVSLSEEEAVRIRDRTLGARTMTYSGQRSALDPWWSEDAEKRFIEYGGLAINEAFGYV